MWLPNRGLIAVAISCWPACAAQGGMVLTLSDLSSDETDAAVLSASLEFTVDGDALELTVRNLTEGDAGYDLDAVFFNTGGGVDGLELLTPLDGWSLLPDQRADGFGKFDFALATAEGNDPAEIAPQAFVTFELRMQHSEPISEAMFASSFSSVPPGSHPALAAVKFVNGPGDDSAFGAVIPEPGALLLLACGLPAALRRRT